MAESFSDGMKDSMSIFSTMAMMSNFDSLAADRQQNRALQDANLKRLEREDQRQELHSDTELIKLSVNPNSGIPDDMALSHINRVVQKHGFGEPVEKADVQHFEEILTRFSKNTGLVTGEERRAAFQPIAEKAASHAGFTRAYLKHKDQIEDYLGAPGASAMAQASGFTPATTEHLAKNARPAELMALLKDNDWRKATIYNQTGDVIRKVANGEEVPDGELSKVLTAYHGAGGKLGEAGAEIVKGTTGEAQYNLIQKDLDSLNKTTLTPLTKAWSMIPEDQLIKAVMHTGRSSSLATLTEGTEAVIGRLLPPEQNRQFQENISKMEAVSEQADKKWKDFQARAKIARATPTFTTSDGILLDQQETVERQKHQALTEPLVRYKKFIQTPTAGAYKDLLNLSKNADETLRGWEGEKQKLLTITEQKTQEEISEGKTKLAGNQGTNDAQSQVLSEMSRQGLTRADEVGVRKIAAPIVEAVNQKYNVKIDVDELLKGFKPSDSTLTVKFPDATERKEIAETANLLQSYNMMEAHYDPSYVGMVAGKFGSAKEATGAIGQQQADFYQAMDITARAQRKLFGGVAVTPTELKLLLGTVVNRGMSAQQWESSVRMNKIILGGDAKAKIEVLKELGFKTPEKTAKLIDDAIKQSKGELTPAKEKKGDKQSKAKTGVIGAFTMEGFAAMQKAHPDWSPAQIGAAMARGEE